MPSTKSHARSRITTRIYCASALALTAVALVGCGGSKQAKGGPLTECESNVENRAAVNTARDAFNAGSLGTANQLASNQYLRRFKRSKFLDDQGHLLPYDRLMATDVSYGILEWVNVLEGSVGKRVEAARLNARANSPCKQKFVE